MSTTKPAAKRKPKAKAKAKPKPAAKQRPTNTNEGNDTSMSVATQTAATAKPAAERDYKVLRELKLDVTDPASLVEQLLKFAGSDDENPQPVTVLVVVGTGKGNNPKTGLTSFGADNELDGDYDVAAATSFTSFKNVKTERKTVLSIG